MSDGQGPDAPAVERFAYPPNLDLLNRGRRRNRSFFLYPILGILPAGFAIAAVVEQKLLWWLWAALSILFWAGVEALLRLQDREERGLAGSAIEYDPSAGELRFHSGRVTTTIDLSRPYEVSFSTYVAGRFLVTVSQGPARLRFSTAISDAKRLLVDILKKAWPDSPG